MLTNADSVEPAHAGPSCLLLPPPALAGVDGRLVCSLRTAYLTASAHSLPPRGGCIPVSTRSNLSPRHHAYASQVLRPQLRKDFILCCADCIAATQLIQQLHLKVCCHCARNKRSLGFKRDLCVWPQLQSLQACADHRSNHRAACCSDAHHVPTNIVKNARTCFGCLFAVDTNQPTKQSP